MLYINNFANKKTKKNKNRENIIVIHKPKTK